MSIELPAVPAAPELASALTTTAVLVTVGLAVWRAPARGLDARTVYVAGLLAVLGGLGGGLLLWLATHGSGGQLQTLRPLEGGQSVFGVLAGATLAAALYLRARRLPVREHADLAAAPAALGYALARLGCFVNGDDFGRTAEISLAVRFASGSDPWREHLARGLIEASAPTSLPVHPVQLYLAVAGLGIFLALSLHRLPRGVPVAIACLVYGAARFALEPLRDDFVTLAGPLSLPQLCALVLGMVGAGLLLSPARQPSAAVLGGDGSRAAAQGDGSAMAAQPGGPALLREAP